MKRRLAGSAVAGLVAASLLVTACSSDADGGDDGAAAPIEGADGAGEASGEPEPEEPTGDPTPEDDGIDRPEIRVADDLEMVFEEPETDDPVEKGALLDNEWQIRALYEVITTHDSENSSLSFYTDGDALLQDLDLIQRAIDQGISSAGRMRYFNRVAEVTDGDAALISYCRDFTEVYTKKLATGEVVQEADPDALPTHYTSRLELGDNGVWKTVDMSFDLESPECR
ncbi:hypothetical protein GCM10027160_55010 [Streptomyces calidiresistens]|uniref:Lipoprotein n=1 Tax=Streptomyces calidiresistens TaxID=1485586 RepID=A0A7W3XY40_9ACTN|nr:hypothetical protein [Streptomyces calidiresistens]MBB0231426.1 hypothetical protein [Streptomyces calidiresistens]